MERGIKIKELAALLNVSENTVINWEKGRTMPDRHYRQTITDKLGMDL